MARKHDGAHARWMATPLKTSPAPTARSTPTAPAVLPPTAATAPTPSHEEICEYANHLYVQRGSIDGHDRDDWLEAEACLNANIPKESCRTRMHHHTQITERARLPLVPHGRS